MYSYIFILLIYFFGVLEVFAFDLRCFRIASRIALLEVFSFFIALILADWIVDMERYTDVVLGIVNNLGLYELNYFLNFPHVYHSILSVMYIKLNYFSGL